MMKNLTIHLIMILVSLFKPNSTDNSRNGLGLVVKVRGLQWQQFLASDVIFWLYEVTNTSTTDYSKVDFGMLCGT